MQEVYNTFYFVIQSRGDLLFKRGVRSNWIPLSHTILKDLSTEVPMDIALIEAILQLKRMKHIMTCNTV